MFDLHQPSDSAFNWSKSASSNSDLDQRLGLYRVFLKLYEHHRELLNEILDLETMDARSQMRNSWQYIQGVIQGEQAYLTTNLIQDRTQLLMQPQKTWVIGRDRRAGILIQDQRLSRRHAVIRYVQDEGFYLSDLNSTNGTYLNGEPVRRPTLLKDGDRVRLGNLSFVFFLCSGVRMIDAVSPALINQASVENELPPASQLVEQEAEGTPAWNDVLQASEKETSTFVRPSNPHDVLRGAYELSAAQKEEILERFLNR